ncbi:TPA: restriction endonuclease subunit S [Pseudomonas aeruginosa]|nr:restriction endonuclease subunit S [Pseudomonas aeruginosa]AWE88325.1 type I restriction modification DNA specificity domain protein [Pseudomonas aeruginosa]EIU5014295.1 restriction endonuclease subunit S [Pseudomonas aeruginosa]EIZ7650050.1 restriction endonuclease subunit S [Pseudomonas aeruginosa]EJC9818895.1 restriction endonuclease subunit S [Pseudomonas aeruginosa]EJN1405681.1 restriction endonuclease subunit S [Pseudomonas aeruginosa]
MTDIPNGWMKVALDDVCQIIRGITFPTTEKRFQPGTGLIACLRTANVQATVDWDDLWFVPRQYIKNDEQLVSLDDILISTANSYELVGKVSRVTHTKFASTLGAFISLLRAYKGVDAGFLYYQMSSESVQRSIREMSSTTTNISNVSGAKLKTLGLSLAPSAEQTRIVAKLEELLSNLDAGVTELKAAQKKLAQYRQSLLKEAVEGALTAEWRARHTPTETAAQLLERILTERRARWEAKQLAKFAGQGKTPPKDWQKKYPEPVQPDTTDLPDLPEGWIWASLDMLGEIASGVAKGTKRDAAVEVHEVPYLRVANVQRGFLDLSEVKKILATQRDIAELTLQAGDVLFNEGGDRDKLGRGWVWRNEVENCIHQNHVFRMRPFLPEVLPELISHHGNTFGKAWFQSAGKQTTNLASINMTMLRRFPVPLGPADEQHELLCQLDVLIEQLDRQEKAVELGLKQSAAQRQNILRAAFAGQLVPQDPNDEPASVLMERIHAERAERDRQPKVRKTKQQKEITAVVSKLIDVLAEEGDWIPAQEAFRRCGVADGALTERIEELYAELRKLDKAGRLAVEAVIDAQGRKLHDKLKLLAG